MSTLVEIEAVLPTLSPEELARIETALSRLRYQREVEARFDGRPWPTTSQEIAAMLTDLDVLPPLLAPEEVERLDCFNTN